MSEGSIRGFQPLLAASWKEGIPLQFPLLASVKLDGIRCIGKGGQVLTRKLKLVPNLHVRSRLEGIGVDGLDGELIVGETFQATSSGIMSHEGEPSFTYWVFDRWDEVGGFAERYAKLVERVGRGGVVRLVPHRLVRDMGEMLQFEEEVVEGGGEGIMLRAPDGRYKYGRSTVREGILFKVKRFEDTEATIIGLEERMGNDNVQERDERGYAKRSTRKEGRVPLGVLGGFVVENPEFGRFNVSSGAMGELMRSELWSRGDRLIGKSIKFKYQRVGVKDKPRCPVFIGFRED